MSERESCHLPPIKVPPLPPPSHTVTEDLDGVARRLSSASSNVSLPPLSSRFPTDGKRMAKPSAYLEFEPNQRCRECDRHQRTCLIRDHDEKCKSCSDFSCECVFRRTVQLEVEGPRSKFTWEQLIHSSPRVIGPVNFASGANPLSVLAETAAAASASSSSPVEPARLAGLTNSTPRGTPNDNNNNNTHSNNHNHNSNSSNVAHASSREVFRPMRSPLYMATAASPASDSSSHVSSGFHWSENGKAPESEPSEPAREPRLPSLSSVLSEARQSSMVKEVRPPSRPSPYIEVQPSQSSSSPMDFSRKKREFWCTIDSCAHARPFGTRNDLDRHKFSVHRIPTDGQKVYICQGHTCAAAGKRREWPRKDNFKNHCKVAHPDEDTEDLVRRSETVNMDWLPDGREPRPASPKRPISPDAESQPPNNRQSIARWECPKCGERFSLYPGIEMHCLHTHGDRGLAKQSETVFECWWPECKSLYRNLAELRRHEDSPHSTMHPNGSVLCSFPDCDQVFASATELDRHFNSMHRDSGSQLFECSVRGCSRTGAQGFRRKDHFRLHMQKVHGQEVPRARHRKERGVDEDEDLPVRTSSGMTSPQEGSPSGSTHGNSAGNAQTPTMDVIKIEQNGAN